MFLKFVILLAFLANSLDGWLLGPFEKQDEVNPIMGALWHTQFDCPVRKEIVNWEEKDIFNPCAIVRGNKIHMLYRAEDTVGFYNGTSRIGVATSDDGINFVRRPYPVFYPDNDEWAIYEWEGGCEDPRIALRDDGTYIMTYTAYDGILARLMVASSRDLWSWTKHGPVFGQNPDYIDLWSKAGSIICRASEDGETLAYKINGRYWMYWGETDVFIAESEDLINWTPVTDPDTGDLVSVFKARPGKFDSDIVEPGPQAMVTPNGIVLIYNSRNLGANGGDPDLPERNYAAGQVLLDINDPTKVLNRTDTYFMKPDKDYELIGQVGNVVFLEGLVWYKGKLFLYYGTADSKIAVAIHDPNNY